MSERTIQIGALTRVEGEGGLYLRLDGEQVAELRLEIYEPPRLFESLLRGRQLEDVPDITARICGICPVAYQMSSVHALEQALGVEISPEIRRLRRLLYCGEWIESHALHVYLLHAPDFFGFDSGLAMAAKFPNEVQRGLRLKKHGNALLEVLGGRAIHPINVAVGGFFRGPRRQDLQALIPDFQWGLDAAMETTLWADSFDFPDLQTDCQLVTLQHRDEYPMNEGQLVTSDGQRYDVDTFADHFREQQEKHSTALHCRRVETGKPYLVGPLARVGLCQHQLSPIAAQLAGDLSISWPSTNPFHAIVARGIELVHAYEEALDILQNYVDPRPARISYDYRAGIGHGATEAPRGTLYHRYEVNEQGQVVAATIVPPTSQNQAQIEADLSDWVPHLLQEPDDRFARQCENLVRCYDPCISCSTHFLKVTVDRGDG